MVFFCSFIFITWPLDLWVGNLIGLYIDHNTRLWRIAFLYNISSTAKNISIWVRVFTSFCCYVTVSLYAVHLCAPACRSLEPLALIILQRERANKVFENRETPCVWLLTFFTTANLPSKSDDAASSLSSTALTSPRQRHHFSTTSHGVSSSVNEEYTHRDPIYYLSVSTVCNMMLVVLLTNYHASTCFRHGLGSKINHEIA